MGRQRQSKSPPLTRAEIMEMYRNGMMIADIYGRAYHRNGWSKERVRSVCRGGE